MGFRVRVNGIEIKFKNRFVLEVIKQYLNQNKHKTYKELRTVFKDELQGSIGVIKNKNDLELWAKNKKEGEKENRFFTKEPISYNSEIIYVCTEWGTSKVKNVNGNIDNFIDFVREDLKYKVEILEYESSYTTVVNSAISKKQTNKENEDKSNIKNIILYGAPGVGKTHNFKRFISLIDVNEYSILDLMKTIENNSEYEFSGIDEEFQKIKDEKRVEFVTFHQSYSYEDFIEGFRPHVDGIRLEDGIFKKLCEEADKNKEQNFYIVIDEINRGNISKIFGELITLIEEDKRDVYDVTLPYSKEKFRVPSNLYIIATMNSTDKSIATIDIALRRRFTFLKMKPNLTLVKNDKARDMMEKLNIYITKKLGEDYQLGHSYFMKVQDDEDLEFVKEYKIKPLLEEYFYAEEKSADEILSEALKNE